jgi:NADPH2:quinone reductase
LIAVVVHEFAPFERSMIGELPDPVAAADEIVIDVRTAEANDPDILVIKGKYQWKPPLPFAPGKAAAGVISALGSGVSGLKVGDRVATQIEYGAYAERLRAPARNVFPIPARINFVSAAALGLTYQTAHFVLMERARMKAGDTVLVLGASGGVGVASTQLAKAFGAGIVIASVRGERTRS